MSDGVKAVSVKDIHLEDYRSRVEYLVDECEKLRTENAGLRRQIALLHSKHEDDFWEDTVKRLSSIISAVVGAWATKELATCGRRKPSGSKAPITSSRARSYGDAASKPQ